MMNRLFIFFVFTVLETLFYGAPYGIFKIIGVCIFTGLILYFNFRCILRLVTKIPIEEQHRQ